MTSGSTSPDDEDLEELQDTYTRIEEEVSQLDKTLAELAEQTTTHTEDTRRRRGGGRTEKQEEPPIVLELGGDATDSERMEELERAHRAMRQEHIALRDLVTDDFMSSLRDVVKAVRRIGGTVRELNERVQDSQREVAARRNTMDEIRGTLAEHETRMNQFEEQIKHLQSRADVLANQLD